MNSYGDLYKILDREIITLKELRLVANDERVSSVVQSKSTKWKYNRYDVLLNNGELYIVYIQKSLMEILNISIKKEKKQKS